MLSQAKYRPSFTQKDALRTMVPLWLYIDKRGNEEEQERKRKKRGKEDKREQDDSGAPGQTDPKNKSKRGNESSLNINVPKEKWSIARQNLLKDGRPCLRLMVQYPMQAAKSAEGGMKCHEDTIDACTSDACAKTHDFLVTVDKINSSQLFGEAVSALKRND